MAFCEALVDGWHADWRMDRVMRHAYQLADTDYPIDQVEAYGKAAEALRVKRLHGVDRAQVWIARNMRTLNEMLWAGRKRDACVASAQKMLGCRKPTMPLEKPARALDKRHDWGTVK